MLMKEKKRSTYQLSLRYPSDTRVIKILKLTNDINIIIENIQQKLEKYFFSYFEKDDKNNSLK